MTTFNLTNGNDSYVQGLAANRRAATINAKDGNDTITLNRVGDGGGDNTVDAGSGRDTVVNHCEFSNFIKLGSGNDTYIGLGFENSSLAGDQVFGGTGDDKFVVQTFHSLYKGEDDNDTFISVGWQNTFNGGSGSDTISFEARDDDAVQGGTAVTIDLAGGFAMTGANRKEFLISIENAKGTNQNDLIGGNNGRNGLSGRGGADDLQGFGGNDRLFGGSGGDLLTGGSGADTFIYKRASEAAITNVNTTFQEEIVDFRHSQGDKLDFKSMDADTTRSGTQHFHFIGDDSFSGSGKELRYSNGVLSGDSNHDGQMDFRIFFDGNVSLVASDFLLA